MFNFLKEKLAGWTKKFSRKEEEKAEEAESEKEKKPIEKPKETRKQEEKAKEPESEKKGFISRLKSRITKVKISDEDFDPYAENLRMLLLENNVAYEIAEQVISSLKGMIVGKELMKKEIESYIKDSLRDVIEKILVDPFDIFSRITEKENKPYVILFTGINGTGKTTTIAKLADFLKKKNLSCVIAAGDTFRAASIEQLKTHGEKLGVPVISQQYGADPAAVGFDAISYAKKNHADVVLIDTAGRMHTAKNLMREIEKIAKVCKPDLKLFIGESITGNDAIEQARAFNDSVGIDGIILTKADVDEKGGTALSVGAITGKPVLFLGTGQEYNALEPFDKRRFTERIGL